MLWTQRSVVVARYGIRKLREVRRNLPAFVIGDAVEELADGFFELGDRERLAAGLGQALGVDQKLVAQHGFELAGVHLGHQDLVETRKEFTEVPGQRPNMSNVNMAHCETLLARAAHGLVDRSDRR